MQPVGSRNGLNGETDLDNPCGVLRSATNRLEWDFPTGVKTLTVQVRQSRGDPPLTLPPPDETVEKAVNDLQQLGGPKAIWVRAAVAVTYLVAKGIRIHERSQENCPQALVRCETLSRGNTSRWPWRHGWTMVPPTALVTGLFQIWLVKFPIVQRFKDWQKTDSRTCVICNSGQEETLTHFLVDCDALANLREVTALVPSSSTLDSCATSSEIPADTMVTVFNGIREVRLSGEEVGHEPIGGTVKKRVEDGPELVLKWETLVPPELNPEPATIQ